MAFYKTIKERSTKLGESLEYYRQYNNLSYAQLVSLTGNRFSVNQLTKWELNKSEPSASDVLDLADCLGMSCDELLRGCPSEFATIEAVTGFPAQALKNLARINTAREETPELAESLHRLLGEMLSNGRFLYATRVMLDDLIHAKTNMENDGPHEYSYNFNQIRGIEDRLCDLYRNCIQDCTNRIVDEFLAEYTTKRSASSVVDDFGEIVRMQQEQQE